MSPFLARIESQLAIERSPSKLAELQAQRAGYLARIGQFEEARTILLRLRAGFGDGRNGVVMVWIMIAEGLIKFYENVNFDSYDRVKRAQFISKNVLGSRSLVALSSAWKAHIEFERSNFGEMFNSLLITKEHVSDDNLGALTRYAMVVCDIFSLCGNVEQGRRWFQIARESALKDGDRASLEALVYNKAAFRLAWLRAQSCVSAIERSTIDLVRMELASARNFQVLVASKSHTQFVHLCEARVSTLLSNFDLAIERLGALRASTTFAEYNFSEKLLDLEIAYCFSQKGDLERSKEIFSRIENLSLSGLDIDDQLVARWMLLEMSGLDSYFGEIEQSRQDFQRVLNSYEEQLRYLNQGVSEYVV